MVLFLPDPLIKINEKSWIYIQFERVEKPLEFVGNMTFLEMFSYYITRSSDCFVISEP